MIFSILFSLFFCLFIIKDLLIDKKNNNKTNYLKYAISFLLIFFCVFIRSYKFTKVPIPINFDESSIGYEAYSLLKYNIDRNGISFPVHLISWGSGQNVLYAYLSIPFIYLFGNSVFSIRLLMLIISSFSCIIMYYLLKDIFKDKYLFLFFIFSIMPWHIMKSRWALESNIFPDIILLILFLYNKFFKSNNIKFLYVISILLGISTYSYGTSYIFIPLFLILNLLYLLKNKLINKKQSVICFLITTFISFPMILFTIINYFNMKELHIFNITIPKLHYNRFETVTVIKDNNIVKSLLLNFKSNIILILQNDDYRLLNVIKPYYTLYYISIPFIFIGLYYLFKNKNNYKLYNIFINNILSSIVVMMFVTKSIHRINCIWYVLIIIVLIGIYNSCKDKSYLITISFIYFVFFLCFYNSYLKNYNKKLRILNNNGYYECLNYIKNKNIKYEKLIISDTLNLPYITYLYVNKINTNYFITNRKIEKENVEFENVIQIGNVYFKEPKEIKENNVYILTKYRTETLKIKNKKCYKNYCVVFKENHF